MFSYEALTLYGSAAPGDVLVRTFNLLKLGHHSIKIVMHIRLTAHSLGGKSIQPCGLAFELIPDAVEARPALEFSWGAGAGLIIRYNSFSPSSFAESGNRVEDAHLSPWKIHSA